MTRIKVLFTNGLFEDMTGRPLNMRVIAKNAYLMTDFHGYYRKKDRFIAYSEMTFETSKNFSGQFGMFGKPSGQVVEMDMSEFVIYDKVQREIYGLTRKTCWYNSSDEVDVCQFYVSQLPVVFLNEPESILQENSEYIAMLSFYVNIDSYLRNGAQLTNSSVVNVLDCRKKSYDLNTGVIIYDQDLSRLIFKEGIYGSSN